jgi:NAD(P)H dehydrogenase (quinone)
MPTIAVTGATGHLGRLVVASLLDRGVDPSSVVALVRSPEKAADIAARGVELRQADYTRPETLASALRGVDRLLLISSSEVGQRTVQHAAVIDAAKAEGVELLAYTGVLKASATTMKLAAEHQETEALLRDSGLPVVLLRNGWYTENYTEQLATTLEHGIAGAAGDGRVAPAARQDYAEAAAAVLIGDGHAGHAYELAGDEALTMSEIAALISDATGRPVAYNDLPVDAYAEMLAGVGLPAPLNGVIADSSAAIARGELATDSGDLSRLIGRPTTPVAQTVREAAAAYAG